MPVILSAPPHAPLCGLLTPSLLTACPSACHALRQQLVSLAVYKRQIPKAPVSTQSLSLEAAKTPVLSEADLEGMGPFLDSLKWDANGLVAVVVQVSTVRPTMAPAEHHAPLLKPFHCMQHVDTGDILMQAYADRKAISETLQTR